MQQSTARADELQSRKEEGWCGETFQRYHHFGLEDKPFCVDSSPGYLYLPNFTVYIYNGMRRDEERIWEREYFHFWSGEEHVG